MFHQRIDLPTGGAYLKTYFLDASDRLKHSQLRPIVLICPGGGYRYITDREAEPMALAFASRGYHAAVLYYPCMPIRFPAPLHALGEAVLWIRNHAQMHHIDPQRLCVAGFSAGGHLAASLGVFWQMPFLSEALSCKPEDLQPQALLLGYPGILCSGNLRSLLGDAPTPEQEDFISLDRHVTASVPPTFLWHTEPDEQVPVEHSLVFANALHRAGVSMELHIYSVGGHGLSLSNAVTEDTNGKCRICADCEGWIDMAGNWLRRQFGV